MILVVVAGGYVFARVAATAFSATGPDSSPVFVPATAPSNSAGSYGTGSAGCPPFPAFPDAKCTGWRHTNVTLRTCEGDIRESNVTLDSCYFPDSLKIVGSKVTITRSHVKGSVYASYLTDWDFQGLTLIDVEIQDEGNAKPDRAAIGGPNFTCLRCHVHHTGTGISMGVNVTVRDSYVHDFIYTPEAHQAAIGANGGANMTLIHNNFDCSRINVGKDKQGCSSAVSLYDEPTINNVLVQQNLLNTAGGYCTYGGGPKGTNIRYIDNRFGKKYHPSCGIYGPVAAWHGKNSGNVWTGNRWLNGGVLAP